MLARFAAAEDGAFGLDDSAVKVRQAFAKEARDTGECTAAAGARDEGIDAPFHLLPDFRRRRLVMRLAVVGIAKLLRDIRVRDLARQFFGTFDRAFDAVVR